MAYKEYTLMNLHSLSTAFKTPKGVVIVSFEGGSRYHNRKGSFGTKDKDLQNAIEKSNAYGVEFTLTRTDEAKEGNVDAKAIVKNEEPNYREMVADAENIIEEQSVTTIQKAKMWLQANYGKTFKGATKAEIKKEAAEVYNTIFVNWA